MRPVACGLSATLPPAGKGATCNARAPFLSDALALTLTATPSPSASFHLRLPPPPFRGPQRPRRTRHSNLTHHTNIPCATVPNVW